MTPKQHQQFLRDYQEAVKPVIAAFIKRIDALPVRYLKRADGVLEFDQNWPAERPKLIKQLAETTRAIYESLRVE